MSFNMDGRPGLIPLVMPKSTQPDPTAWLGMEHTWDLRLWSPPNPQMVNELEKIEGLSQILPRNLTKLGIEALRSRLISTTMNIKARPYAFRFWTNRSHCLLDLGYPELAVGDSYKALLLCESGLNNDVPIGQQVRQTNELENGEHRQSNENMDMEGISEVIESRINQGRQAAFHQLILGLVALGALLDALSILERAIRCFPNDRRFTFLQTVILEKFNKDAEAYRQAGNSFETQKKHLSFGKAQVRIYPWELARGQKRQDSVIKAANCDLRSYSRKLKICPSLIIRTPVASQDHADCYGVFATRRIHKGDTILKASHIFASSLEQGRETCYNCFQDLATCDNYTKSRLDCCKMPFCSRKCRNTAKNYYHDRICGLGFASAYRAADFAYGGKNEGADTEDKHISKLQRLTGWDDKINHDEYYEALFRFPDHAPIYLIRYVAACLQAGHVHPLKYPFIAQLKSNAWGCVPWSLNGMISGPMEILAQLGINVFEDHNWDTWVMVSMWNRITSNSGSRSGVEFPNHILNPRFTWFNHSCEPNAMLRAGELSQFEAIACEDIKADEEIFISVLGNHVMQMKKEQRQIELSKWMRGVTCQCNKCLMEV